MAVFDLIEKVGQTIYLTDIPLMKILLEYTTTVFDMIKKVGHKKESNSVYGILQCVY